jgi:hypothetical protein
MKAALTVTALVLGLVVAANSALAQDAKAPQAPKAPPTPDALLKALAEAGQPGAEHKKLQPFVGDWTLTVKLWTDPSQPPAEAKGTVERKWIMGGRFVQETVKVECHGKTFEGLGLLGYDNAQKKFTAVKACGLCGTISSGLATCDASGKKFECTKEECCPLSGQTVKGRDEVLIESNDRIVVNVFKAIGGKEAKVMEIVSIRKK